MGRERLQNPDVNRSQEPVAIPLNRPPGTFSPTGEKAGMRGYGPWEASFRFCARIGNMNRPLTRPPATLSPIWGRGKG